MAEKPIMERLKDETWPLHQRAEGAALERDLVGGSLPREVYRDQLAQRLVIHRALEAELEEARGRDPRVAAVVDEEQLAHSSRVAEDLRFFGGDPEGVKPLPATARLIEAIKEGAKANPVSLLGFHYVFEGSMNGARFIARKLRVVWELEGTDGTRYLDPYGEEQRGKWGAFKEAMNAQPFSEEEMAVIVDAGKATFQQMIDIESEIYPEAARAKTS